MTHYPDFATDYEARYYWKDDILEHLEGHALAGGQAYQDEKNPPTPADADQTVSTASELISACNSGSHSYVSVNGPLYLGSAQGITTQEITLIGDRGINGSSGPLVYTDYGSYGDPRVFEIGDNVRFTGIEFRGPTWDYWDENGDTHNEYPGYIPNRDDRYDRAGEFAEVRGGDSCEIDNCEIHGWGVQAFRAYDDPYIHHNYIHDNMMTSLGYAVTAYRGHPTVEYNFLDAHRHAINGFGYYQGGYTVKYNVFGPSASSHQVDMHSLSNNSSGDTYDTSSTTYYGRGGGDCEVSYNTFLYTNTQHGPEMPSHNYGFDRGRWQWVYSNRGVPHPGTSVEIHHNRIMHHGPQSTNPGLSGGVRNMTEDAFVQDIRDHSESETNDQGFMRVNHYENQYDSVHTPYDPNYGAPVNVEGPTPSSEVDLTVFAEDMEGTPINDAEITLSKR